MYRGFSATTTIRKSDTPKFKLQIRKGKHHKRHGVVKVMGAFTGACPHNPLKVKVGPPELNETDRIQVRGFTRA